MGLFKKAKRALGYAGPKLRERGIRGTAKVLSAERTMMSEESGGGRKIRIYKHRLLVTVPGSEPYEVMYRKPGQLTVDAEYRTFVDPDDRANVFVDAAAMSAERTADELSGLTGKPVNADTGSILDATAGLIDDAGNQMFTGPAGATPTPVVPTPAPPAPSNRATPVGPGEGYRMVLLSRLDARHDAGEISDEDYEAEKRKLEGGGAG